MILVIFTAFVGMMLAPETIIPIITSMFYSSDFGGRFISYPINMWFDEDIDKTMERTKTDLYLLNYIQK